MFHEVVRFNMFKLRGYEECLGRKTTIWVKNSTMDRATVPQIAATEVRIVPAGGDARYTSRGITTIARSLPGVKWPSSGLCMLNNFIKQGIHPVVIGFDGYDKQCSRNYWDRDTAPSENDPHNAEQEADWLVAAHEALLFEQLEEFLS